MSSDTCNFSGSFSGSFSGRNRILLWLCYEFKWKLLSHFPVNVEKWTLGNLSIQKLTSSYKRLVKAA